MATGPTRDPARLGGGVARWLAHERALPVPPTVASVTHASDGLSNETVVVSVHWAAPVGDETLVVRLAPLEPSFPEYDLHMQAAVHEAVAAAGVPAPVPARVEDDASWLGAPFLVMPFVPGHVPGQAPAFDPWIAGSSRADQRKLHDAFVETLAAVHQVNWERAGLGAWLRGATDPLDTELDWWDRYARWAAGGDVPVALAAALDWCRAHRPVTSPDPVLLWGDPRLGNLVVDDDRHVVAVLDWEMATLGPAEMDLAWYLALDAATAVFDRSAGRRLPRSPRDPRALRAVRWSTGGGPRVARDLRPHRALAISDRQARMRAGSRRGDRDGTGRSRPDPMAGLVTERIAALGREPGREQRPHSISEKPSTPAFETS